MEEKLKGFSGKRVDINCGAGAIFRGKVSSVESGLVTILDEEDRVTSVSIEKILAVTECHEPISRPGFIV
jgi:hypothetical protein